MVKSFNEKLKTIQKCFFITPQSPSSSQNVACDQTSCIKRKRGLASWVAGHEENQSNTEERGAKGKGLHNNVNRGKADAGWDGRVGEKQAVPLSPPISKSRMSMQYFINSSDHRTLISCSVLQS